MNPKFKKVGLPIVIVLGAVIVAAGVVMSRKPPEKNEVEQKAFLVDTQVVETQNLNFIVKSQGTVQPKTQTVLSAQVTGKVVSIAPQFIEGGMFRKGDMLVQLEQADYITDLKASEAELARAQAALEEEQARGKVAAEEWKTVRGSVAPELGLRKPQLAKEMANVRAAEAQLERAQRNLERTVIKAPYDGLVKEQSVDIGQFVAIGTKLGSLYNTDVAEVRMPLSDNDLAYLELPGMSAEGLTPKVSIYANVAGQQASWKGVLARNEGVLDETSRVIYAVAEIKDPYQRNTDAQGIPLKFGRFVTTRIEGNFAENIVVLPRSVLRLDGTVLTVDDESRLHIQDVVVQKADESSVYISSGLNVGDRVITSAVPNPVENMAVRLPEDETEIGGNTAVASTGG